MTGSAGAKSYPQVLLNDMLMHVFFLLWNFFKPDVCVWVEEMVIVI